ncbi:class I SAM-dependent methyltransferase [Marinobacter sp. 1Y8]
MGIYSERILPHIIDHACSIGSIMKLRQKLIPMATGNVLEVGMGSGVNLQFYNRDAVECVFGLEPSVGMRRKAQGNLNASPVPVEWLDLPGEQIPLDDNSVDTIVLTFTLCTIPDWRKALQQMLRVLKPGGKLLFCEHGQSPDHNIAAWQNRITPSWKKIAGGCHLNRPIDTCIRDEGFEIESLENRYIRNAPKIAGYIYYGVAKKPE